MADGDLFFKAQMPSERRLTEELGLSRTTIRKALKTLLDQGVLIREGRRKARIRVLYEKKGRTVRIAFLAPAMFSSDHGLWWDGVTAALLKMDVVLRPCSYQHFADPCVHEALAAYDALFFVPLAQKIPDWLIHKMSESPCRVAILDQDLSQEGFVSVRLFPPTAGVKLLDHLLTFGHRRIDCLNTQGEDTVILERISTWRSYVEKQGLGGALHSRPGPKPLTAAYDYVSRLLREKNRFGTALFCTTGPCAIGAMRALKDAGLEVGRDVSVCAVNDEGWGRYLYKSLTALESPPRSHYLRRVADWMISGKNWRGPLLVQPTDVPLFEGESVGPASES